MILNSGISGEWNTRIGDVMYVCGFFTPVSEIAVLIQYRKYQTFCQVSYILLPNRPFFFAAEQNA